MPICFMPGGFRGKDKDEVQVRGSALTHRDMDPAHQEWREPPGYLGEAVRRAKRIASLSRNTAPPIVQD
jgi:hypothetical protein